MLSKTYALKSAMHVPLISYEMTKASATLTRELIRRGVYQYSEVEFFTEDTKQTELSLNAVNNRDTLLRHATGLEREVRETFLNGG